MTKATFYAHAVPAAESYIKKLFPDGKAAPQPSFSVREAIDRSYILTSAYVDLPKEQRPSLTPVVSLLQLAEEMQDKDPASKTFGNFRWYWRTPTVTDPNAVEFVTAHALPIWFAANSADGAVQAPPLTEIQTVLKRMLHRAMTACMNRRVGADYTNIAIYNAVHLILLGQVFERPDVVKEGNNRLNNVILHIWDHGIYEYNTPTYYSIDINALQLGVRYVQDESAKQTMKTLLDLFWTDLALHWFAPSLRQAGAQSRSYNYLHGVHLVSWQMSFAGLAPADYGIRNVDILNMLHASYKPSAEILALNVQYPRLVERRWGEKPGERATAYILDDIALGTAGARYGNVRQDMNLTVDLGDYETIPDELPTLLPRNYFIPDGREDPYGKKQLPTGNAGHQKSLHTGAFWAGAQRTVDALGISLFTPETLEDPALTNLQSHFVFRKPESMVLPPNERVEVGVQPVILRYGKKAFGIRVIWTRDNERKSPKAYLIDDGNAYGVYRLTVDNGSIKSAIASADSPGVALWVRIGSHLDTEEEFNTWAKNFADAKVERLNVNGNDIDIQVAGTDGAVSANTVSPDRLRSDTGILTLNGTDLGCPILEKIPLVADAAKRKAAAEPIRIMPGGTYWEAESGYPLIECMEPNASASGGKVVRVNGNIFYQLVVPQSGTYYLWAKVFAADAQHDSFLFSADNINGSWHLGNSEKWRWIPLRLGESKENTPLLLEQGTHRLQLRQREPDGLVDRFFLTDDPAAVPGD
ncbi:hypothetical protein FACS1894170_03880 [Planctomycetales bacterium]|nr:hypothetical protein FACS1894170_03880 [Planctomycetales bacterium]